MHWILNLFVSAIVRFELLPQLCGAHRTLKLTLETLYSSWCMIVLKYTRISTKSTMSGKRHLSFQFRPHPLLSFCIILISLLIDASASIMAYTIQTLLS
jgi:hypothetical protein